MDVLQLSDRNQSNFFLSRYPFLFPTFLSATHGHEHIDFENGHGFTIDRQYAACFHPGE